MKLELEYYWKHNYHNEKVVKWVSENLDIDTDQAEYGCERYEISNCNCDEPVRVPGQGYFFVDEDGKPTDLEFVNYYEKVDAEELAEEIPGLTEEEKEELIALINLRIYGCPNCGTWSLDGDDAC